MYSYLHPDIVKKITLSNEERIDFIKEPRWIGYPRAHDILNKLEDTYRYPRQSRMPCMLVVGRTNNGKTMLVRQFLKKHPVMENPNGDHVVAPVLYIEAPPTPSEDRFYTEVLNTLFEHVSGTTSVKSARVVRILKKIKTKVMIVDEMHNLLAGSSTKQSQYLNAVRYLSNNAGISIVGCGTGDLVRAVSVDDQLQNRFVPHVLDVWRMSKTYRQLLTSFEYILPLKQESKLYDKAIAAKLLAMCEGTIGELSTLLNTAAIYAIRNGDEKITNDVLNKCDYISPSDRTKLAANI